MCVRHLFLHARRAVATVCGYMSIMVMKADILILINLFYVIYIYKFNIVLIHHMKTVHVSWDITLCHWMVSEASSCTA
jgi:hypothetical protein